jgi:pyruvate-ferredoxin/flavodoxin oxidoreductase
MKDSNTVIKDGNEAAASVAYRTNEVIAIYPITPSSAMAEFCDEWKAGGKKNIWGNIPEISELQSEGGVAGAVHGALQAGALTTTFTASQGLLLMIPNMYKIAGELTPFCMHVSARSLATHALSIFGDQSDVMACRQTGFAFLASNSPQEAHDLACIAHSATLKARIPFVHFFDGFRTSHEINTFQTLSDDILRAMIDPEAVLAHRQRALSPDHPVIRGTAQNPDVFFQGREAINPFYAKVPAIVADTMAAFAKLTGRHYQLFDYEGDPNAEHVVIAMGSGAETLSETAAYLNKQGRKTGVLKVRLFRPFSIQHFINALPKSVKAIAVLDRTKEPGALGEPLYQDIITALQQAREQGLTQNFFQPKIIGGRYGLGSKDFTPSMAKAVFDELTKPSPKNSFTVGIEDDVSHLSLNFQDTIHLEGDSVFQALFFGLGADGTVGANKNTIKIIGDTTPSYAQAYFVYDSKKSGAITISHLRFGPQPIRAPYLIQRANFIGCHQFQFVEKYDLLENIVDGGVFLLNAPFENADELWNKLPKELQAKILEKNLNFYAIDAYKVAKDTHMGTRTNTIMQTCFFAISGILPKDEAIAKIKDSIKKTYGRKGEDVVQKNFQAVDQTLANLHEISLEGRQANSLHAKLPAVSVQAPDFVKKVIAPMIENYGDRLPVSAFSPDGTWPTATAQWEKRNIAQEIPAWKPELCIQCNRCSLICPHAAIRSKFCPNSALANKPEHFQSVPFKSAEFKDHAFVIQVAPEDCTGCTLCANICPAKSKENPTIKAINMVAKETIFEQERENFAFFEKLPDADPTTLSDDMKSTQFKRPLFEFSGACSGCGETPYIKLLTQMVGDRLVIANATGCTSIYSGNLPTTPYCVDAQGRGPAWANSLFEDNAEFGLGMRLAIDNKVGIARQLLQNNVSTIGDALVNDLLSANQSDEKGIAAQRKNVQVLKEKLRAISNPSQELRSLLSLADELVDKAVWIIGGDGWAYDIGFGGLDHVLASQKNVKVLVLDTEVYSNTGGQQSKSTPMGAVAKFAATGKATPKKDLGLLAMAYRNIYVAQIAMGANAAQATKAFNEAQSYPGPSLIIAYSHCIAHGYDLSCGLEHQQLAVDSGHWPLYRFDPRKIALGINPLKLDSGAPKIPIGQYTHGETRYSSLITQNPQRAQQLETSAQENINARYKLYQHMAEEVGK